MSRIRLYHRDNITAILGCLYNIQRLFGNRSLKTGNLKRTGQQFIQYLHIDFREKRTFTYFLNRNIPYTDPFHHQPERTIR